jgi:CheY-like chemotaxis protein/anti-sigma regulatory factor (Ser/Thr protein kinase)
MSKILVVDDDPCLLDLVTAILCVDGYQVRAVTDAAAALHQILEHPPELLITDYLMPSMDGLSLIRESRRILHPSEALKCILITAHGNPEIVLGALREHVNDFLVKPFLPDDLRSAVATLLTVGKLPTIEVLSASLEWVNLRVPCCLGVVPILQKLLAELRTDFPEETREAISYAFREMINNAIEYGGKSDPTLYVRVTCVRLRRAILFCIGDPGKGFNPSALEHSAVSNPSEDLLRHAFIRSERGLRPGGFGILLTKHLVDELLYNEQRNEVLFVKYF